jgi:hypothetical protein
VKNKLSDVRDHLVAMLESLADPEVSETVIERAKTTALVADKYIAAVKVEVDACRVAADLGYMPAAIDAPRPVQERASQVLSFEQKGYRSAG